MRTTAEDGKLGVGAAKKFLNAAIAPLSVFAEGGIIVGAASWSVYGMRINGLRIGAAICYEGMG